MLGLRIVASINVGGSLRRLRDRKIAGNQRVKTSEHKLASKSWSEGQTLFTIMIVLNARKIDTSSLTVQVSKYKDEYLY